MTERPPHLLAAALCAAVLWSCAARADVLERRDDAFAIGDLELSTPYAMRPLVAQPGLDRGFRFDGSSNWLEAPDGVRLDPASGVAVGAWVAMASPPGDTAAVVYHGAEGLLLGVNRWRQPVIRFGNLRAASDEILPVGRWVHLAGDHDGTTLRLRVDGAVVAEVAGAPPAPYDGLFAIGRALDAGFQQGTHPLGAINGVMADVTFRRSADPVEPEGRPPVEPDFAAPKVWYEDDPDRPRLLPLGATGWANEPHALTFRDGLWHLYYQANPNGAYWRDIVWGHLVSKDLVDWERRRPALMPGTGFDRRGVWVGNWIPGREPPAVVYTGVNGQWAGIGLAEAGDDGSLRLVRVLDHDTPREYQDMRDPWVVRTEDGLLMLIGAGRREGSGAFVYSYRSADGETWERSGRFDTGAARMPGQYWELPMLLQIEGRWVLMGTPVFEDAPARTLYWVGAFDGTRFTPDDPEPKQLDVLATYRAPTIAEGPDGQAVAIGIVADEIRDEQERHEAGWVHALSPPTRIGFCAGDAATLCHAFEPAFAAAFDRPIDTGGSAAPIELETGGTPVMLRARLAAADGGLLRVGLRVDEDGEPAAELTIDARTGEVRLDYSTGPIRPIGREAVIEGTVPPASAIDLELMIDGAVVFGTINGRAVAMLVFAGTQDRDALLLSPEGSEGSLEYELSGLDEARAADLPR
ncbi:LamG-like jellyroll fold domain-containing protein [Aquibium sp. ELW1220]|uniref:LamG-like jellyroll fold domain-containing protein n=1 Tax=Aquibium sp. ELW1220 TaxID=2976766 RepID=UPI0025B16959|nr:LamG-like jellyroll fold domain-containing protein [Aquibium sp. ELW1220]MDN2584241.1 hypothetical protein [Aquibium sp. ELW1220]